MQRGFLLFSSTLRGCGSFDPRIIPSLIPSQPASADGDVLSDIDGCIKILRISGEAVSHMVASRRVDLEIDESICI